MRFTPPASGSTRLSDDVWALLCRHAESNGNSSTREALEQLVRQSLGQAQVVMVSGLEPLPSSSPVTSPPLSAQTAAAALDALLLD